MTGGTAGGTILAVRAVAVWGAGIDGPAALGGDVAAGAPYAPPPPPAALPANERRRASPAVRLALHVAALALAGLDRTPRAVFASANGDGDTVCAILADIAAGRAVSPTAFHNSVHNAAAGYWAIGRRTGAAATCLAAYDDSVAAGLLQAAADAAAADGPVLFCAYDCPVPPPLAAKRPIGPPFAFALLLDRAAGAALGRLGVSVTAAAAAVPPLPPGLAALRDGNPAARGLPLLRAVATGAALSWRLEGPGGRCRLQLEYEPCAPSPT